MAFSERACNALVGLSVLSWAVLGMVTASEHERTAIVRLCTSAINVLVGLLFVLRRPLQRGGSITDIALCLPAFLASGLAFKLSSGPAEWPRVAETLFAGGTVLVLVSFLSLGRCFAVFPAVRGAVSRGPYQFIRHPAYLGEFLLVLACFLASRHWWLVFLPLALLPCIVVRILVEEKLLAIRSDYRAYAKQVVWRLMPGVW